jgi:hypothetical protein
MMTTWGDIVGDTNLNQIVSMLLWLEKLSRSFLMCNVANVDTILQKSYVFKFQEDNNIL